VSVREETEKAPVLAFRQVSVARSGHRVLDEVDWEVRQGERWVVLGPNGSGKTTLLRVAAGLLWPTAGEVELLGFRVGRIDLRSLRSRIALVSQSVLRELRPSQKVREVVTAGRFGALETWWHRYEQADWEEAERLLAQAQVDGEVADRAVGVISEGERQQVLLARALMGTPELLLLDEPAAGLDLGARERLVDFLGRLAGDPSTPPIVLVSHHTEEVPPEFTHALLLARGRVLSSGPIADVLTSDAVSECFLTPVSVTVDRGRWWTRVRAPHG
jgi:iron complex transport system ATP-binding protein